MLAKNKQSITHARKPGVKQTPRRSQARLLALERQRQALELRKAGATYRQIADQVGYSSPQAAHYAVQAAMNEVIFEPIADFKAIQIERLNHMLVRLWPKVNGGDERAMETSMRIMERLDALMGTASPQQVEHHHTHEGAVLVIEGSEDDYTAGMEQMARRAGAIDAQVVPSEGGDVDGGMAPPALPGPPAEPADDDAVVGGGVLDVEATIDVMDRTVTEIVGDSVTPGHDAPCARYVRPADPDRAAAGHCARCPAQKEDHR